MMGDPTQMVVIVGRVEKVRRKMEIRASTGSEK